jgi:hypothetical protein
VSLSEKSGFIWNVDGVAMVGFGLGDLLRTTVGSSGGWQCPHGTFSAAMSGGTGAVPSVGSC